MNNEKQEYNVHRTRKDSIIDRLDENPKIEPALKIGGTVLAAIFTTGVGAAFINEHGPREQVDSYITQISYEAPGNTAIGAVKQAVENLAEINDIPFEQISGIQDAGNAFQSRLEANDVYVIPGTKLDVAIEKKPFSGYAADVNTVVDPANVPNFDN